MNQRKGMITGKTKLVALIGQPVSHSISPIIHNAALEAMNLDWCYIAMACQKENLESTINNLRALGFQGLNITIPYKNDILNLCSNLSPLAKKIGAINTLIPNKEGGWTGDNTDVYGFLYPLIKSNIKYSRALVLGCGGSARGVVSGLQSLNLKEIIVIGRDPSKLDHFLSSVKSNAYLPTHSKTLLKGLIQQDAEVKEHIKNANLIVNTTPVGMTTNLVKVSELETMPLGEKVWKDLKAETTLYDLIYTPRPTAWLKYGEKQGCKVIDGLEMLIQQGAESLKLWSGNKKVPIKVMREAAKEYLNI